MIVRVGWSQVKLRQRLPELSDEVLDLIIDESQQNLEVKIYLNAGFMKSFNFNNFTNNVFNSLDLESARLYVAAFVLYEYIKEKEFINPIFLFSDTVLINLKHLDIFNGFNSDQLLFLHSKPNNKDSEFQIHNSIRLDMFVVKSKNVLLKWIEILNKSPLTKSFIANSILTLIIRKHAHVIWEIPIGLDLCSKNLFPNLIEVKNSQLQANQNPDISLADYKSLGDVEAKEFFVSIGNFYSKQRTDLRIRYLNEIERLAILNFASSFKSNNLNLILQKCYERGSSSLSRIEREILRSRYDLQVEFNKSIEESNYESFYSWVTNYGVYEYDLKSHFISNSVNEITSAKIDTQFKIIYVVLGYPNSPLGVGMSAVYFYKYLQKTESSVYLVDIPLEHLNVKVNNSNFSSINWEKWVELIHQFDLDTKIIYIVCINGDRKKDWEKVNKIRRNCDYFIGYFAWELDVFPHTFDFGLNLVDEIWVPSTFVKEVFQKNTNIQVNVVPHPIEIAPKISVRQELMDSLISEVTNSSHQGEYFFFSFDFYSCIHRKNVLFLVEAYSKAKFKNSRLPNLVIKCLNNNKFPEEYLNLVHKIKSTESISLIEEAIDHQELLYLIHMSKGVIGLQKSEGYGLLIAEALSLGKWVICTNYSGPRDYINSECAILVDFELVPVSKKSREYGMYHDQAFWASPDLEQSISAINELYSKSNFFNFEGVKMIERNNHFFYSQLKKNLERISKISSKKNVFRFLNDYFA